MATTKKRDSSPTLDFAACSTVMDHILAQKDEFSEQAPTLDSILAQQDSFALDEEDADSILSYTEQDTPALSGQSSTDIDGSLRGRSGGDSDRPSSSSIPWVAGANMWVDHRHTDCS
jgi:hypothetical protein